MSNGGSTASRQPHPSGVSDGNYPSLPQALVEELRELIVGDVFARTDQEFQSRTTIFNGNVVTPAKAAVIPSSAEDVSKVLKFCAKYDLYPSIKAGGYGTAGWAINGDIVVDLSGLNGIHIEPPLSGDKFTSLKDMSQLGGDEKGEAKAKSVTSGNVAAVSLASPPGNESSITSVNSGKRRRSMDLSYSSPEESGGLPRDPLIAKFLHAKGDLPTSWPPAVRRRLDVDRGRVSEADSPFASNTSSSSTSKVKAHENGHAGPTMDAASIGMERHSSNESEKTGRTPSNDGSISASTSACPSISASDSTSTTFTTPSTAPTSPRPKSTDDSDEKGQTAKGDAMDIVATISAGLYNQPEVLSSLRQRSSLLVPEETPLQSPASLLSTTPIPTPHAEPFAEPPPPSRTPSFSIRSEDPFGYMSAAPSAPPPVLRNRMVGVPPSRGYEQYVFEAGSSSASSGAVQSPDPPSVPMMTDGAVDDQTRSPLLGTAPRTAFLSETATPVHPHAFVSFGAGVKQKDIDIFTAEHPLPATTPSGNVSSVAYHIPLAAHPVGSSVMLLGGFGFLSRLHGLSIDSLVEVEMVLADGSIVYVNEKEHPDLWWAIRGAGPAFGVVTRYKAKAYPVPVVFAGNLIYNFHAPTAASLIKHFRDCVKSAPRELYANVLLTAGPADKGSLVVVQLCYIGNRERGRQFLEAIASWDGEPCLLNEVSEKSFLGQQDSVAQILRGKAGRQWFIRSALITSLPDEIIHKTVNEFADTPVGCTWFFELAGGAVADTNDTCFPKEQREVGFTIAAFHQWELDDDDPLCVTTAEHWIEKTLAPVSTGGPYPAFLGRHEKASRVMGCFGSNWDRLCEVKKKYDPRGLFRHNFWPLDADGKISEPCESEPKSPVMHPREV